MDQPTQQASGQGAGPGQRSLPGIWRIRNQLGRFVRMHKGELIAARHEPSARNYQHILLHATRDHCSAMIHQVEQAITESLQREDAARMEFLEVEQELLVELAKLRGVPDGRPQLALPALPAPEQAGEVDEP